MVAILAVCAGVRVAYLLSPKVAFNADEAVTGIMASRIQHGQGFAFYAGQHYGGTLEQYLQALSYALLPLPHNAFTLRLTQVALSVATCGLVVLVGRQMLTGRLATLFAALLFAVSPWFNVVGTATSQGFYVVGQTLGMATWWVALKLGRSTRPVRWAVALGLLSGLALWTSVTTVYYLVPAAIWVAPVLGRRIAGWAAYLGCVLVGAAPVVGRLVTTGGVPVQSGVPEHTTPIQRVGNLFGPVLREFTGVRYGHDSGGIPISAAMVVTSLMLCGYAVAVVRRRHGLADLMCGRLDRRRPTDLLLLVGPVIVLAYAASSSTWYVGTPRYLLIAYPLLGLSVAAALPRRRPRLLVALCGGVALVASALTWGFFGTQGRSWSEQEPQLRAVTATLQARHERTVLADYWTAMPLLYLSGGGLDVGVTSGTVRFPDEQRAAESATHPAYVELTGDGSAARQEARLDAAGVTYRTTTIGRYVIIDQLSPRAPGP